MPGFNSTTSSGAHLQDLLDVVFETARQKSIPVNLSKTDSEPEFEFVKKNTSIPVEKAVKNELEPEFLAFLSMKKPSVPPVETQACCSSEDCCNSNSVEQKSCVTPKQEKVITTTFELLGCAKFAPRLIAAFELRGAKFEKCIDSEEFVTILQFLYPELSYQTLVKIAKGLTNFL